MKVSDSLLNNIIKNKGKVSSVNVIRLCLDLKAARKKLKQATKEIKYLKEQSDKHGFAASQRRGLY